MAYLANILDLQDYQFSKRWRTVSYAAACSAAFLLPFSLGQPQLVVGSVVNAALIFSALNFKKSHVLPIIFLPSLAVLTRGVIFGPLTVYLFYSIPAIWLSNSLLVIAIKDLYLKRKWNKYFALAIGITIKVMFLYAATNMLVGSHILPKVFISSMGITQFYTAVIGGVLALSLHRAIKNRTK